LRLRVEEGNGDESQSDLMHDFPLKLFTGKEKGAFKGPRRGRGRRRPLGTISDNRLMGKTQGTKR